MFSASCHHTRRRVLVATATIGASSVFPTVARPASEDSAVDLMHPLIDQALKANEQFAKRYDRKLGGHPEPKIAIVTCMDPRLSDLEGILGLKTADIDVIRTGGPAVTDDVLGELVVSTRVLGSREIMLLNHTGCGFTTFTDKELNDKLAKETGDATPVPMRLFSFKDPEENTRAQIEKVRSHPWIAKDVPVRGFIFDVDTGRLREVKHG